MSHRSVNNLPDNVISLNKYLHKNTILPTSDLCHQLLYEFKSALPILANPPLSIQGVKPDIYIVKTISSEIMDIMVGDMTLFMNKLKTWPYRMMLHNTLAPFIDTHARGGESYLDILLTDKVVDMLSVAITRYAVELLYLIHRLALLKPFIHDYSNFPFYVQDVLLDYNLLITPM